MKASAPAFDARARLIAAAVLGMVVLVAVFQQAVARDLRFTTQFAEVPKRLPVALAVLFPIGSVASQLVVHTWLARTLEPRKIRVILTALITLLAGAAICVTFNVASALASGTFEHDTPRLFVKGLVGGVEVYGLWLLALKYPKLVEDVRLQALQIERVRQAAEIAQLREHLQPHFLRNTLNAVAALVLEDPSEARNLLAALADASHHSLGRRDSPASRLRRRCTRRLTTFPAAQRERRNATPKATGHLRVMRDHQTQLIFWMDRWSRGRHAASQPSASLSVRGCRASLG